MTGLLGVYMFDERWEVARFGLYGLMALQHRGQETAGLVTWDGSKLRREAGFGLVEKFF